MIKILLVEDEVALRETLQEILEFHDFEVHVAGSGEEALLALKEFTPKLIVSDIMMPGISGFELINNVHSQEKLKHIPFIFLSALTSEEDQKKSLEAGASGYITKPFKSLELLSLIKKLV